MRPNLHNRAGFTLIEMIVVMVITGIITGMVAMFIRAPVQGYADSARRAEMADIADTALRRLGRDIRTAVPNSVRLANCGGTPCVEFLPTKAGGRYRADAVGGTGLCGSAGDELSFAAADTCFEIIGPPLSFAAGDQIVVGSTQSDGNPPYQDPAAAACGNTTSTCIRRPVQAGGTGIQKKVVMTSAYALPSFADLPSHRFAVVPGDQQAVTYACVGTLGALDTNNDGQAKLVRYSGYGFNPAQALPATPDPPVLADKVSACNIVYDAVNQRNGLLAITLAITQGGERISLYHEIHISNAP